MDITSPTSLGFVPEDYSWFKNGESLIVKSGNSIYEFNLNSGKITLVYNFQNSGPIYAVNGRNVIIYTNSKYYNYENETRNLLSPKFELPVAKQMWLSQKSDELLYLKAGEILYFINLKKEMVEIGKYDVISISNDGQNALLRDSEGKVYSFRAELIVATNKIQTSLGLIEGNYDPAIHTFKFSPDNNYLLQKTTGGDTCSFKLIGLYGENNYALLETDRQVGNNNFGLVNGSREFLILLKDIVPNITTHSDTADTDTTDSETAAQPVIPDANLYKIELVD